MRIAHHSIAPAKHQKLSAELCRGQQVPNLPVTADYYRNSGEPCRRNQCQVRIEIEGMSDRDVKFPQMPSQPPTAPKRLYTVEAAAETELLQLAQTFKQRPFF